MNSIYPIPLSAVAAKDSRRRFRRPSAYLTGTHPMTATGLERRGCREGGLDHLVTIE